ncbi:hypothetical protein PIB30_077241 [Stylosanthes scabra]|uniref:Uncharacterized protein n=1 Tax=Stylosanthes scabra TaxID=79078 RepID=A0ABU6QRL5_9FABA|nr:hypothetical protein [Stylosanthes scabra]
MRTLMTEGFAKLSDRIDSLDIHMASQDADLRSLRDKFRSFRGEDPAMIGTENAKKSARNEKITKKSLEAKSNAYAYAPKTDVRKHCHDLGVTSRLELDPVRTHQWPDLCL